MKKAEKINLHFNTYVFICFFYKVEWVPTGDMSAGNTDVVRAITGDENGNLLLPPGESLQIYKRWSKLGIFRLTGKEFLV
ncbi:MAG: hypothetical protein R2942_02640 [Ignavibacteria bacterium]